MPLLMRTHVDGVLVPCGSVLRRRCADGHTSCVRRRSIRCSMALTHYHVKIKRDVTNTDGEHEVTAVASGKFLDQTRRVTVLFLIVGETVVCGQVLDEQGLPPVSLVCSAAGGITVDGCNLEGNEWG